MKNLEKGKYVATGMAISAVIMGTVVPVIAKSTQENITAIYKNIKVVSDGVPVNTGNAEAFIANGTTYLPVRAIGEAIGKKVTWDGNTNTVYLGQVPGEQKYLTDICPPYGGDSYRVYKGVDNKFFTMSGKKRTNGFTIGNWNGFVLINTDGKYRNIKFDVGHLDEERLFQADATLNIYLDGKLVREIDLKAEDTAKEINIPLNNALQVKFELVGSYVYLNYGFADIEIN